MTKLNHPTFGELEQSTHGNWDGHMCSYLLGHAQDWYQPEDKHLPETLSLETFIEWTWPDHLSFANDGTFSLWFYDQDGKIFAGYVIIAEYDKNAQFKDAGIHG